VVATNDTLCGILQNGTVSCWGELITSSEVSPTAPPLRKIFAGYGGEVCALGRDGAPRCPIRAGAASPPPGPFLSLAIGPSPATMSSAIRCGVRADGSVQCWGDSPLVTKIPVGVYRQVVVGEDLVCLLDAAGQVKCWGARSPVESYGEIPVPPGTYLRLAAGSVQVCAIKSDRTLVCWSTDGSWQGFPPPAGSFVEVAVGTGAACGIRTSGESVCWGPSPPPGIPPDDLRQIGTFGHQGCGLTTTGEVVFWGGDRPPEFRPTGVFVDLTVGAFPCALRRNGEMVCFGGQVVNGDSPR
jgi:hypothetical protein